jgi:hypothetical protein
MKSGIVWLLFASILAQGSPEKEPGDAFTSKSGGFSVAFPGVPTESFRTEKTESGPRIHKLFEFAEPGKSYRVICADLAKERQPKLRQDAIDGIVDMFTRSSGGKVLSQKKLTFQGEPGIEVTLEQQRGIVHGIYFIKGKRLFQITLYYADQKVDKPEEFEKFVESFKAFPPVGSLTQGMDRLTTWQDYRSESGKYRIKAIGDPKERVEMFGMPSGPAEVKLIRFLGPKGENYGVFSSTIAKTDPAQTPEVLFEAIVNGAAENLKARVESRKVIDYQGKPGLEALIALPGKLPFVDGVYKVRLYWIGDQLYQLIFVGPREKLDTKEVNEFFDSFQVDEKSPTGK